MTDTRYTVLITFHGAENMPIADAHNLSCDPYLEATVVVPSRPRPPDEPPLLWRTPTQRCTRDPEWNSHWVISGVPAQGFVLEMRVKDEDTRDRDDRLGRAEATFGPDMMREGAELGKKAFKLQKRKGSVVPWVLTYVAAVLPGQHLRKHNRVIISAKVLGKAADQKDTRVYTLGPNAFTQHFSPLIGSMVNRGDQFTKSLPKQVTGNSKKPASASSFVATKLQLTGPTPAGLRNHYVGYNRFIVWIYAKSGLIGHILYYSLRKQYRTIYSYNKSTLYGVVDAADEDQQGVVLDGDDAPYRSRTVSANRELEGSRAQAREAGSHAEAETAALASAFLHLTKYGAGGRMYTYVLTLDAEWRFSETGDEFAVDFLSKHMMHANGAQVVMYAGEFFVRRIGDSEAGTHDLSPEGMEDDEEDKDPRHYELVIDNNSGTYRPDPKTLPTLQTWFSDKKRLGGLGRVTAMDAFDDKLKEMVNARKELKKRLAGGELPKRQMAMRAGSSASSLKIDGRKMSSGEVERVVAEAEKENEEKAKEENSKKDDTRSNDPPKEPGGNKDEGTGNNSKGDKDAAMNGGPSYTSGKANADQEAPTIQTHDSGIQI